MSLNIPLYLGLNLQAACKKGKDLNGWTDREEIAAADLRFQVAGPLPTQQRTGQTQKIIIHPRTEFELTIFCNSLVTLCFYLNKVSAPNR